MNHKENCHHKEPRKPGEPQCKCICTCTGEEKNLLAKETEISNKLEPKPDPRCEQDSILVDYIFRFIQKREEEAFSRGYLKAKQELDERNSHDTEG